LIEEASLGFPAVETRIHLIRSGAAMAMFLSGVSTIIIQHMGHWKSNAFLEYIRDKVENFTASVAERMLQYNHFHTINATQSVSRDETREEHNKNGPMMISHAVKFSGLALRDCSSFQRVFSEKCIGWGVVQHIPTYELEEDSLGGRRMKCHESSV
jgi:hypothetical protein